jgi:ribosome maturation factor RimP
MKELKKLITDIVEGSDTFIEDIKMSETGGTIKVICDTDSGIDSGRLVEVSRKILANPEYDATYAESYRLEVSSPGLDMPLTQTRHFIKNKGREIDLTHKSEDHKSPLKGTIVDVDDDHLVLAVRIKKEETNIRIAMNDVVSAKLRLKW